MPVGTAMMEYPSIMMNEARILPNVDTGVMSPYPTVVRVTIDQYMLWGIEEKLSLWWYSTRYIRDPNKNARIKTKNKKINILRKLRINANTNSLLSSKNFTMPNILNIRSRRKDRMIINMWLWGNKNSKKEGKMAIKSNNPKVLVINFFFTLTQANLSKYSKEKITRKNLSNNLKYVPYLLATVSILSLKISAILANINNDNIVSKILPALVFAWNITTYNLYCQEFSSSGRFCFWTTSILSGNILNRLKSRLYSWVKVKHSYC